jgi:hypothetical protein
MSLVGMAGSIIFGFVSDKIGGARALALIALDDVILWSLLLMDLPYTARAVLIGLIGMHGAGAIPAISKAMASTFGESSFSRAFGLASTATLPLMVAAVVGFGVVFQSQGQLRPGHPGDDRLFRDCYSSGDARRTSPSDPHRCKTLIDGAQSIA